MAVSAEAFVPFEPDSGAVAPLSREGGEGGKAGKGEGVKGGEGISPSAFHPFTLSPPAHAPVHGQGTGRPVVTLQREGERVTGIRVECACGQVIELACSY